MKTRIAFLALVAGLTLAFGILAAACGDGDGDGGGDGGLTLEEYFQQLETLSTKLDDDAGALGEQMQATQDVEEGKAIFAQFVGVLEAFVADLEALDAPDEAQAAHDEAVAAGSAFLAEFQSAVDASQDATTFEEIFAATESEGFTGADEAFTATCVAMEGIATDNSITVDLGCED